MDLFSRPLDQLPGTPLAERLRPRTLEDFVGQPKIYTQVSGFLKQNFLPNLIFWGPPGCGKTTLAQVLANVFDAEMVSLHAVETGAKALREEGDRARDRRRIENRRTLVFIDEIHRLNKAQQDVLLPFMEQGDLVLIGATTENPSYELNRALLSRARLLVFEPLSNEALALLLKKAAVFEGFSSEADIITTAAAHELIEWADGDARRLIGAIEEVVQEIRLNQANGPLDWKRVEEIIGIRPLAYDKNSDQHYDIISAFIKSVRGSEPQAALYWLARMVKGGEDPLFIARRLVILASEDVGNADPKALPLAMAAAQAVELIGWPEAGINLAHATTYLATAPKSNRSYLGYKQALEHVEKTGSKPVPPHLRSAKTSAMKDIGYGKGYLYPHDYKKGWVEQDYSPEGLALPAFYEPSELGFEKTILQYRKWREDRGE